VLPSGAVPSEMTSSTPKRATLERVLSALPGGQAPGRDTLAEGGRLKLSWLVQLHWWAILGQVLIVGLAELWTEFDLPIPHIMALLTAEVIGNLVLRSWARTAHVTESMMATVMVLDAAVLTLLLDLTGGAANPYSTLYLVNVALAAVLLPGRWSWVLMAVSLLGFASLFLHEWFTGIAHHVRFGLSPEAILVAHVRASWVALALAAIFIVYFVRRVALALVDRERELQQARVQADRREKLASLATLAAGAAHELSTPLSTIIVVAKELQRNLGATVSGEVARDLMLIREQVSRCREILDRMAGHAGEQVGEPLRAQPVPDWVTAALDGLPGAARVVQERAPGIDGVALVGPPRALADALRGLLKNALQASGAEATVTLRLESTVAGRVRATVIDHGGGMSPEVLARVGEPFFTTKVPGQGMGLGLFLTRALAEQLGGAFHITSSPERGTEARLELPAAQAGERSTA
jgi:two-component system sensor histidine kinase RegB